MRGSWCSFLQSRDVLLNYQPNEKNNYLNKLSNSHITTQIYTNMDHKEYFVGYDVFLMFAIEFFFN